MSMNKHFAKYELERGIEAYCWTCLGGTDEDCGVSNCALYVFRLASLSRPYARLTGNTPNLWWKKPRSVWKHDLIDNSFDDLSCDSCDVVRPLYRFMSER